MRLKTVPLGVELWPFLCREDWTNQLEIPYASLLPLELEWSAGVIVQEAWDNPCACSAVLQPCPVFNVFGREQGIWVWHMKERLAGKLPWKNNVARQIQALLTTGYFFFSVVAKKKICLTKVNMVRIEGSCTNSNFRNKPLVYSS